MGGEEEFASDAKATLFDFRQIDVQIVLATGIGFAYRGLWTITKSRKQMTTNCKINGGYNDFQ